MKKYLKLALYGILGLTIASGSVQAGGPLPVPTKSGGTTTLGPIKVPPIKVPPIVVPPIKVPPVVPPIKVPPIKVPPVVPPIKVPPIVVPPIKVPPVVPPIVVPPIKVPPIVVPPIVKPPIIVLPPRPPVVVSPPPVVVSPPPVVLPSPAPVVVGPTEEAAAAWQTEMFIKVTNSTEMPMRVSLIFLGKDDSGAAAWLPVTAEANEPITYELKAGETALLGIPDAGPLLTSRVRVWAETDNRKWLKFQEEDLVLVEQPYQAAEPMTFPLVFGEK